MTPPSRYRPHEKETWRENRRNIGGKGPESESSSSRCAKRRDLSSWAGTVERQHLSDQHESQDVRTENPWCNTKAFCFIFAALQSDFHPAARELFEKSKHATPLLKTLKDNQSHSEWNPNSLPKPKRANGASYSPWPHHCHSPLAHPAPDTGLGPFRPQGSPVCCHSPWITPLPPHSHVVSFSFQTGSVQMTRTQGGLLSPQNRKLSLHPSITFQSFPWLYVSHRLSLSKNLLCVDWRSDKSRDFHLIHSLIHWPIVGTQEVPDELPSLRNDPAQPLANRRDPVTVCWRTRKLSLATTRQFWSPVPLFTSSVTSASFLISPCPSFLIYKMDIVGLN